MKKKVRILSIIFLIAIYCFAMGIATESIINVATKCSQTDEQEKCFSSFSTNLFCHTLPSESSVNIFNNLPAISFKIQFNEFLAISKISEQLFETKFFQYTIISRNFLIKYSKTNIVFPFHYFW